MTVLCIDLDGTLIRNDTTWLAVQLFMQKHPFQSWRLLVWLLRGRAYLKHKLGQSVAIDPRRLPYHMDLIVWLKERQQQGDTLVLATATDEVFAKAVAAHLGIFSQVIASNGVDNLRAQAKAAALTQHFGLQGYCYAGNSRDDLAVWREAHSAIVVNAAKHVETQAREIVEVVKVFD